MSRLILVRLPAALARLLEAFDAQQVRGQSGTITAVVNALAKAGIELGENGSIFPRPKGKARSQIKGAPTEADAPGVARQQISRSPHLDCL